ncbi:hypothetical protein M947_08625 [Sulfurimonas hongkongensis]|uniref:Uncharacterized protein n=1 Tax=Sulfurimonas hongkongensis TaxID=1172190 RepID=T0KP08_9BACT|nr:hypothetical protein M947_08625 [Sulfurimonas hongkongensis]
MVQVGSVKDFSKIANIKKMHPLFEFSIRTQENMNLK